MHQDTLKKSLSAGQWALANTIAQRVLVFGTFFILARILTPADFGIIAIIAIVPSFLDGITTFAFDTAAFQKKDTGRYLNVVWTFNILRSIGIFLVIFVAAPLVADFFHIEYAINTLRFAGASILIQSFINIGQIYFFKNFDFRSVFFRDLILKGSYALIAIVLAFIFKSYWALFFANILSFFCVAVATYILHPYRPRLDFNFRILRELRNFSQWLFAQEMVQQAAHTIQDSVIGRFTSPASLGLFGKAQSLADAPTAPLISSINKVSFSSYVDVQESTPHVAEGINKTFDVLASVAFPYVAVIVLAGHALIRIALGAQWIAMAPILTILVVEATIDVLINSLASPVFNATGKTKTQFLNSGVRAFTLALGMLILVPLFGILGAAYAALVSVSITACAVVYHLFKNIELDVWRITESIGVVVLASLIPIPIAAYALTIPFWNTIPGFLLLATLSGILYLAIIIFIGRRFHRGPYKTLKLIVNSFFYKSLKS